MSYSPNPKSRFETYIERFESDKKEIDLINDSSKKNLLEDIVKSLDHLKSKKYSSDFNKLYSTLTKIGDYINENMAFLMNNENSRYHATEFVKDFETDMQANKIAVKSVLLLFYDPTLDAKINEADRNQKSIPKEDWDAVIRI